jgi:hypothetical protein
MANQRHRIFTIVGVIVVTTGFLFTPPAKAIFGFGDIVFDPTAVGKLVQQIHQYEQMVQSEMQLYQTTKTQYEMLKFNLEQYTNKQFWKTWGVALLRSNVDNRYGETAVWNQAVNYGQAVPAAWSLATVPVQPGEFLAREPLGNSSHLSSLAAVEIQDSTGQVSMSTLAAVRQQQQTNGQAINQLEQTALSGNPDDNTEIKQLNLLNAAQVQNMRMQQGTQAVQAEILEQLLAANLDQRNLHANALNTATKATAYQFSEPTAPANVGAALTNYDPQ